MFPLNVAAASKKTPTGGEVGNAVVRALDPSLLYGDGLLRFTINPSGTGPLPPEPPILENDVSIFVDEDLGDDSNNGFYGDDKGGSNGPFKTLNAVNSLNLTNIKGIYFKTGTTITCKTQGRFWNRHEFRGDSTNYAVIGAYYMDGSTPKRGLGAGGNANWPILQGTVTRPYNYDGSGKMNPSDMYPPASDTDYAYSGLIGAEATGFGGPGPDSDGYVRVENLHLRHSGGMGIRYREYNHIQVVNVYVQLCLNAGVQIRNMNNFLVDRVRISGCGRGRISFGYPFHPAILSLLNVDTGIVRDTVIWQSWGEMYDSWNGCRNILCEDNVIFDTDKIHYYIDSTRDSVFRRNLGFQSGGNRNNDCSDFQTRGCFSHQGSEQNQGQTQDTYTQNNAIYANVMIGTGRAHDMWHQAKNAGEPTADFKDYRIFRNTQIDNAEDYNNLGSNQYIASAGVCNNNMHLAWVDGQHTVDPQWPDGDWDLDNNAWNLAPPTQFPNNIVASWAGDMTGFDNLGALTTWEFDDHVDVSNVDAYIAAIKAKLGAPTGGSVDGGKSLNIGHPDGITIAQFDNLDFFKRPYLTEDCGAIAA